MGNKTVTRGNLNYYKGVFTNIGLVARRHGDISGAHLRRLPQMVLENSANANQQHNRHPGRHHGHQSFNQSGRTPRSHVTR